MSPGHATSVVLACCILHNYLRNQRCNNYCPPGYGDTVDTDGNIVPGIWREEGEGGFGSINATAQRNPSRNANQVRETFTTYLNQEGALNWQTGQVTRV